ncbi:unnamed protein product [Ilex paraguariensis]|uniref:Uncharacterized protein n=1 Tax=Ilex paraguariensis TaxID=185542 RepID=A0ABC8T6U3_9AQUA
MAVCVGLSNFIGKFVLKSVAQGAAITCYVALHQQVKGISGEYFSDSNVAKTVTSYVKDADLAKKLWDFSVSLTQPKRRCKHPLSSKNERYALNVMATLPPNMVEVVGSCRHDGDQRKREYGRRSGTLDASHYGNRGYCEHGQGQGANVGVPDMGAAVEFLWASLGSVVAWCGDRGTSQAAWRDG